MLDRLTIILDIKAAYKRVLDVGCTKDNLCKYMLPFVYEFNIPDQLVLEIARTDALDLEKIGKVFLEPNRGLNYKRKLDRFCNIFTTKYKGSLDIRPIYSVCFKKDDEMKKYLSFPAIKDSNDEDELFNVLDCGILEYIPDSLQRFNDSLVTITTSFKYAGSEISIIIPASDLEKFHIYICESDLLKYEVD